MQVSTNINPYQNLNMYQRAVNIENPTIQPMPLPEEKPLLSDEQKQTLQEYKENKELSEQEKKDQVRQYIVASTGVKSKQTQFEIYMSEMTNSDVEVSNDTNILEQLRETQKQNDIVKGYATYKELQNSLQDSIVL